MIRFFITVFAAGLSFTSAASAEDLLAGADIGYGEYLSGECVTCHSQKGVDKGIPAINGLDAEVFATVSTGGLRILGKIFGFVIYSECRGH